jgi:D-sedoheptulose 7-phosphate isomerase
MKEYIKNYRKHFVQLLDSVKFSNHRGQELDTCEGIELVCNLIKEQCGLGGKIISIGNGGSAAITSHLTIDFWKNGQVNAMAFNDASLLTCISNDFGYQHVFEKPIEFFAEEVDILIAISSSGRSENILRGVSSAQQKGCSVVTLSGFDADNPLRFMGLYNFHVPSRKYGLVEVVHQYICHCISDVTIHQKSCSVSKIAGVVPTYE